MYDGRFALKRIAGLVTDGNKMPEVILQGLRLARCATISRYTLGIETVETKSKPYAIRINGIKIIAAIHRAMLLGRDK